jgi:hypothetical protein
MVRLGIEWWMGRCPWRREYPGPAFRILTAWSLALAVGLSVRSYGQQANVAASADAPGASVLELSMHDAVQLALKQNPRLLAARLEALESAQQTRDARSAFLPQASPQLEEQMNRLNLATLIGHSSRLYQHLNPANVTTSGSLDRTGAYLVAHAGTDASSSHLLSIASLSHAGVHQVEVLSYADCFLFMAAAGVIAICLIPLMSPFVPASRPTASDPQRRR